MAVRTAVQCTACDRPYSARLVEDEIVLPTADGRCACGNGEFAELQAVAPGGTTG